MLLYESKILQCLWNIIVNCSVCVILCLLLSSVSRSSTVFWGVILFVVASWQEFFINSVPVLWLMLLSAADIIWEQATFRFIVQLSIAKEIAPMPFPMETCSFRGAFMSLGVYVGYTLMFLAKSATSLSGPVSTAASYFYRTLFALWPSAFCISFTLYLSKPVKYVPAPMRQALCSFGILHFMFVHPLADSVFSSEIAMEEKGHFGELMQLIALLFHGIIVLIDVVIAGHFSTITKWIMVLAIGVGLIGLAVGIVGQAVFMYAVPPGTWRYWLLDLPVYCLYYPLGVLALTQTLVLHCLCQDHFVIWIARCHLTERLTK